MPYRSFNDPKHWRECAQRGTDRYDNCRMTLKEKRNGVITVRVR